MLAVILHGAAADAEFGGDCLRVQPLQQQARHLPLPAGEALAPHAGDGLLHRRLQICTIGPGRVLGQQWYRLPPLLATQGMHQRKQRLQPGPFFRAQGLALVETTQKQN
ncbi:hypothetical protein D3C84_1076440 [compost metagenome]